MSKQVIKLSSHQLTDYQTCQEIFKYNTILNLEKQEPDKLLIKLKTGESLELVPGERKRGLVIGTLFHWCLALYFRLVRRGFAHDKAMFLAIRRFDRYKREFKLKKEDEILFAQKFMEYISFYSSKDTNLLPVAVESGFSLKLYEDKAFVFIYEGTIDLICLDTESKLIEAMDHKTQTRDYNLNPLSNQFIGYAWALYQKFPAEFSGNLTVNYIGFQKTKNADACFTRDRFNISQDIVKEWKQETIYWFHRVAQSTQWHNYVKSRSACDTKYGRCDYWALCRQTDKFMYEDKINREFKQKDKIWQSWE